MANYNRNDLVQFLEVICEEAGNYDILIVDTTETCQRAIRRSYRKSKVQAYRE